MAWTISQPVWTKTSNVKTLTIPQLAANDLSLTTGSTDTYARIRNIRNEYAPTASSEIITQLSQHSSYTGSVAKAIASASRFPVTTSTKLHSQHNTTLIAQQSDETCCAENRYGPLSVAIAIGAPNVPIITNEMIIQALVDLLGQFVTDSGDLDFLAVMRGSALADIQ